MQLSFNSNAFGGLKVRRQKFGFFSLLFLLVFGAGFLAIGLVALNSTKINPSWTRVSGQVVSASSNISNGSTTYAPVVKYTVNGQSYQITSSSSNSSYPAVGSSKQVAYDPAQPSDAKVVDSGTVKAFLYVFPVVGILALVIAPIAFMRSLRRSHDINSLKQTGQKLQGVITDIQTATVNNANGGGSSSSYKIVVSATAPDGTVQTYTSDTLDGIGGLAMADFRANPIAMDVYVNPSNPKDYYVDISEVPSLTPGRIQELITSAVHNRGFGAATANQQPAATPPFQPPAPPAAPTPPAPPAQPPSPQA